MVILLRRFAGLKPNILLLTSLQWPLLLHKVRNLLKSSDTRRASEPTVRVTG